MMTRTAVLHVGDVMTPNPVTIGPDRTVAELVEVFLRHDYNALPVVEDDGILLGLVTKLDLLRLLRPGETLQIPDWTSISDTPVDQIMRHGVISVELEDTAAVAADLMVATGLRSLPVVQRGPGAPMLCGMLSRGDLLKCLRVETATARKGGADSTEDRGRRT